MPVEQVLFTRWKAAHATNLDQFRKLRAAGVVFVAGTDAGWRFTRIDDQPMEIARLHEGGMSLMEAITASAGFAAKVIGIEDKLGALLRGLAADILVVESNPLDDLGTLRNVRLVMQNGKLKGGRGSLAAHRARR
jgi:imidazolonepropionase-like amidohydrolase